MIADLAAQKAIDRLSRYGADAMNETDRTVAAVWLFCSGVANAGFARYYSGWRGDLAHVAPWALRAIGARALAGIASEANAVFGPDGPPRDRRERQNRVHALPESARATFESLEHRYYACEEEVDSRLERFLTGPTASQVQLSDTKR